MGRAIDFFMWDYHWVTFLTSNSLLLVFLLRTEEWESQFMFCVVAGVAILLPIIGLLMTDIKNDFENKRDDTECEKRT